MGLFSKKKKENESDKIVLTHPIMITSGASNLFVKALDPTPTKFHLKESGIVNIKGMMKKSYDKNVYIREIKWNEKNERSGGKIAGGALVGTLIAGPLGTIAGAGMGSGKSDKSTAELHLLDINENREVILFIQCKKDDYTKLTTMIQKQDSIQNENFDAASEIRKFKELLDDGIITEDEFEDKKKQLLDL